VTREVPSGDWLKASTVSVSDAAFAELRAFEPGPATAELVRRCVDAAIRTRNIPPPDGGHWDLERRRDTCGAFLADAGGGYALVGVAIASNDPTHLRRQLLRRIRWWFADAARTTPVGRHRRRVRAALTKLGATVTNTGPRRWALAAKADSPPWDGRLDDVTSAAKAIAVEPPRPGGEAPTDGRSYQALCTAVLAAAGGPMSFEDLSAITARRLNVTNAPDAPLPGEDDPAVVAAASTAPDQQLIAVEIADQIWDDMDDRQRYVFGHLHETTDEAHVAVDHVVSRSTIGARMKALKTLLAGVLTGLDDELLDEVARELQDRHRTWLGRQT